MTRTIIATTSLLLSLAGGVVLLEQLVPEAAGNAAEDSFKTVVDNAYLLNLLGTPWEEALATSHGELRRGEDAMTIEGTTLTWQEAGECYTTDVPDAASEVVVNPC